MTTNIDRRRFLTAAGGTAAVAAAAGVGGELLISKRYRANMAPASSPPPTPLSIKPVPSPGNAALNVPGLPRSTRRTSTSTGSTRP